MSEVMTRFRNMCPLEQQFLQKRNAQLNLDRFVPNRAAMDFDYAHYMLTLGPKRNPPPKESVYKKVLAEALSMNRARILAFRNKPSSSAPTEVDLLSAANELAAKPKRRRHIRPTPDRKLDAVDFVDDYYLNLLDWGSSNVLAIALKNSVYLWDASNGNISELATYDDEAGLVTSVSWAPDGYHIAIGLENSQVELWNSTCNEKLTTLEGFHRLRVGSMAWNDHILTTGGQDGSIVNSDFRVRSPIINAYYGHQQEVCGLKWSPSGQQLASGGNDNILHIWDISSTNHWLHRLEDHTGVVKALAWCPFQRNLLASGGGGIDQSIKFWNTNTGACLNSVETGSDVSSLLWNKKERELLGSNGNHLALWNYPSMTEVAQLTDHNSRVLCMAQSPDGCTVASVAGDESLCLWNVFGEPKVAKPARRTEPFAHFHCIR